MNVAERPASTEAVDDIVLPFAVESLSTRGRPVRLGPAIDALLKRHAYPDAVSKLVAEAVTLAALLGSTSKTEGRFHLQTKSDGQSPCCWSTSTRLRTCVRSPGLTRRGSITPCRRARSTRPRPHGLHHRSGRRDDPLPGSDRARRPGIRRGRPQFFRSPSSRSRPWCAWRSARSLRPRAAGGAPAVSSLNTCPKRRPPAPRRLPSGRRPQGGRPHQIEEDDAWTEAQALAATTEAHELIDPTLSGERLLYRLFNERGVRVYEPMPLAAVCRLATAEGVDAMLRSFSPSEVREMVGDDGMIGVTCEFCSTKRLFNPADYGA